MLTLVFLPGLGLANAAELSKAGGNWDEEPGIEWISATESPPVPREETGSTNLIRREILDPSMGTPQIGHHGECCPGAPCDWLRPCGGIFAEYQNVWLRPQLSEPENGGSTTEYLSGQRFIFGHINSCGNIWRGRYFNYAATTLAPDPRFNSVFNLEYADFERARRFSLGSLYGELSAGLRWAQWEESADYLYTDTIGPVLGGEIHGRSIFNLTTFAAARHSIQFGEVQNATGGTSFPTSSRQFGSFSISEMQLGVIRNINLFGRSSFVKGFFEAQYWAGPQNDDSQNLGLVGLGAAFGTTF